MRETNEVLKNWTQICRDVLHALWDILLVFKLYYQCGTKQRMLIMLPFIQMPWASFLSVNVYKIAQRTKETSETYSSW